VRRILFAPLTALVTVGPNKTGINFIATQFMYTVSGKITLGGAGMEGVTVSDGAGHTTTTNSSGDYTLSGLIKGIYLITPIMRHYGFMQATSPVVVDSSKTGVDFTAILLPYDVFLPLTVN
jgi:hypothetical protein